MEKTKKEVKKYLTVAFGAEPEEIDVLYGPTTNLKKHKEILSSHKEIEEIDEMIIYELVEVKRYKKSRT